MLLLTMLVILFLYYYSHYNILLCTWHSQQQQNISQCSGSAAAADLLLTVLQNWGRCTINIRKKLLEHLEHIHTMLQYDSIDKYDNFGHNNDVKLLYLDISIQV